MNLLRKEHYFLVLFSFFIISFLSFSFVQSTSANEDLGDHREPLQAIPQTYKFDKVKAQLGEKLFFDARLSSNNTISCSSCHRLSKGGVDSKAKAIGVFGAVGARNTPTVYNSALNFRQFWDGRVKTLAEQAGMSITNPKEMAMESMEALEKKLLKTDNYKTLFEDAFSNGLTELNIRTAIAEYVKTLVSPNSPFDRYLQGDKNAISSNAKKGYALFKEYNCTSCHQGRNVGGNMFQRFGVLEDGALRNTSDQDLGRYNVTKKEWDKRVFKVPSLRFVIHTAPYFHDGSVETLSEAIDVMARFQLGRELPDSDKRLIIEFFKTLPGDIKADK